MFGAVKSSRLELSTVRVDKSVDGVGWNLQKRFVLQIPVSLIES
jgi:hypothetical protein